MTIDSYHLAAGLSLFVLGFVLGLASASQERSTQTMSHKSNPWRDAPAWAIELRNIGADMQYTLELLLEIGLRNMGIAQDLEDEVAAQTTVIGSVETFVQNAIDAIRSAGTDQAKLAAVLSSLQANKTRLGALIAANTPAAPEAVESPAVPEITA